MYPSQLPSWKPREIIQAVPPRKVMRADQRNHHRAVGTRLTKASRLEPPSILGTKWYLDEVEVVKEPDPRDPCDDVNPTQGTHVVFPSHSVLRSFLLFPRTEVNGSQPIKDPQNPPNEPTVYVPCFSPFPEAFRRPGGRQNRTNGVNILQWGVYSKGRGVRDAQRHSASQQGDEVFSGWGKDVQGQGLAGSCDGPMHDTRRY